MTAKHIDYFLGDTITSSWCDLKINLLGFRDGLGWVDNFELNIGVADGACTIMLEIRLDPLLIALKAP